MHGVLQILLAFVLLVALSERALRPGSGFILMERDECPSPMFFPTHDTKGRALFRRTWRTFCVLAEDSITLGCGIFLRRHGPRFDTMLLLLHRSSGVGADPRPPFLLDLVRSRAPPVSFWSIHLGPYQAFADVLGTICASDHVVRNGSSLGHARVPPFGRSGSIGNEPRFDAWANRV